MRKFQLMVCDATGEYKPVSKIAKGQAIHGPEDAFRVLVERHHEEMSSSREHFILIKLNARSKLIGTDVISVGTLTASLVHPREVFRPAIMSNAARIIVAHNHPSASGERYGILNASKDEEIVEEEPKGKDEFIEEDLGGACFFDPSTGLRTCE